MVMVAGRAVAALAVAAGASFFSVGAHAQAQLPGHPQVQTSSNLRVSVGSLEDYVNEMNDIVRNARTYLKPGEDCKSVRFYREEVLQLRDEALRPGQIAPDDVEELRSHTQASLEQIDLLGRDCVDPQYEAHKARMAVIAAAGARKTDSGRQGYLGTRRGGLDIFPLGNVNLDRSGEQYGGEMTFGILDIGSLNFRVSFFQGHGSASAGPQRNSGEFTLVPSIVTPGGGFSFNNINDLAAVTSQRFAINQRGIDFFGNFEFNEIHAGNGTGFVPILYGAIGDRESELRYDFTIGGYDTSGYYGSVVHQRIYRAGAGVRVQNVSPVGNDGRITLFAQGTIGAAHHRVRSEESHRISIFNGAINSWEDIGIRGNSTGLNLRGEIGARYELMANEKLRASAGVTAFIERDSAGSVSRTYAGGPPALVFNDEEILGIMGRVEWNFLP